MRSNRANRKRSTFRGGRGDNLTYLYGSAAKGRFEAERRAQFLSAKVRDMLTAVRPS